MALGELKNGIGPDAYAIYQQVLAAVVERDHPVGSLYISNDPTSPASLFGGTWERIKDRFILAAGDTYAAGSTGGEAAHALNVKEAPTHHHVQYAFTNDGNANPVISTKESGELLGAIQPTPYNYGSQKGNKYLCTQDSGDSMPHNNMPPYIAMYVWRRIA